MLPRVHWVRSSPKCSEKEGYRQIDWTLVSTYIRQTRRVKITKPALYAFNYIHLHATIRTLRNVSQAA